MQIKMKERKISYTIMIASDSSKNPVKTIQLKAAHLALLAVSIFLVLVFIICYMVYSSITLSDTMARNKKQGEQIQRLKELNEELTTSNKDLEGRNVLLSQTVNQKVAKEQEIAAVDVEAHLPTGFPLNGSAQIQPEAADAENQQEEIVFEATVGINVIAAGEGIIEGVDTDAKYGNVIHINHENGYITSYRNAGTPMVKLGDKVLKGTVLYIIGEENTAIEYQIKQGEEYINPMEMIEISG